MAGPRSLSRARLLAAWWDALVTEDRLEDLFDQPPRTFGAFLDRMTGRPVYASHHVAEDGVTLGPVMWGIPWFRGIRIGMWLPAAFRKTRHGFSMMEDLFALAFREYPVLVAVAREARNSRLYQRYGFTGLTIPGLGPAGEAVWIGWISPATWRRRTKETAHE